MASSPSSVAARGSGGARREVEPPLARHLASKGTAPRLPRRPAYDHLPGMHTTPIWALAADQLPLDADHLQAAPWSPASGQSERCSVADRGNGFAAPTASPLTKSAPARWRI